jgi:hypothetical protein
VIGFYKYVRADLSIDYEKKMAAKDKRIHFGGDVKSTLNISF